MNFHVQVFTQIHKISISFDPQILLAMKYNQAQEGSYSCLSCTIWVNSSGQKRRPFESGQSGPLLSIWKKASRLKERTE